MLASCLDKLWRRAATGFAFAFLFGGGAILAPTVFPLVALTSPAGAVRRQRCQHLVHLIFRFYIRMLRVLRVIDVEVEGAERLRDGHGKLVVANHPSLLDVVLLMALMPRAQCIVKKELWESRWLGGMVRGAGYIRNDLDPEALLDACRAALEAGDGLIIFPEGTRTVPGEPVRFRRGFANLATLLEAEVQPVTITCNPPTLIKGEKWWMIPPRRPIFRVMVGDRLDVTGLLGYQYRSLAARKLVRSLEDYFAERLADGKA
ncbi:1-acyl-sn-glycerol-3-phosphate acyltransferase [Azospirillum argentinense]|uniref:1-acyl-sn-glycerol-3-phosphate acyltransferase n=1 Tax=Azospirillum argentinense TaxID=2970906 RepID=A0A2K1FT22_9PROT|nr:lysophospholipid acyltransferase family protein [Azospirillum argentinense]PNQ95658.1 1-acyl-sn-glycerol-3-phosphate acyltransferase [Azospirillum argentinense]